MMRRISLPLTSAVCSFAIALAAYADKTTTTTAAAEKTTTSTTTDANDSGGRRHHNWVPDKKAVLSLPSLDGDQKTKIEAIYEKNREAFNAIQKQRHDLQESEWQAIKPLLKPEQVASLSNKPHRERPGAAKPQTAPLDKGEAK